MYTFQVVTWKIYKRRNHNILCSIDTNFYIIHHRFYLTFKVVQKLEIQSYVLCGYNNETMLQYLYIHLYICRM